MAYYNENEPFTVAWLKELQKNACIEEGEIDGRSIKEVQGKDITDKRAHFFAGIAGWDYALSLANWPKERPVWTGSCPCQPFSSSGKQKGFADKRHLWPEWLRLIKECHPSTIFGEQVASKLGREWLSRVFTDLETLGYAVAGADLCAAGVGAPHLRQRLFWVAYAKSDNRRLPICSGGPQQEGIEPERGSEIGRVGDPQYSKNTRLKLVGISLESQQEADRCNASNPWAKYEIIRCADGKARRIEPGIYPLAYGVPKRMGQFRGYGNAIVPQVAAAFIKAFMETEC